MTVFCAGKGATLKSIVDNCVREVATADAEMQLAQRSAWLDLNKGFPLAAGLDHLEYLGVTEVKMTLRLKPMQPGLWSRVAARVLRKKPRALFHLCADAEQERGCLTVTVTISRGSVRVEPDIKKSEDAYVADFSF